RCRECPRAGRGGRRIGFRSAKASPPRRLTLAVARPSSVCKRQEQGAERRTSRPRLPRSPDVTSLPGRDRRPLRHPDRENGRRVRPIARAWYRDTSDTTSGTTTCRPARASRLPQAPPTRDRDVERPARVGRPAGGALAGGARLPTQPARPDPPPALPVLPTAGGTGPAVRRGEAAQAARRRLGFALAGRQPGLGALKRVQGRIAPLPGAGAAVAGGGRGVRPRPGAAD